MFSPGAGGGRLSTNSDKDWVNSAPVTTEYNTRPSSVGPAINTQTQDTAQRSVVVAVVVVVVVVLVVIVVVTG